MVPSVAALACDANEVEVIGKKAKTGRQARESCLPSRGIAVDLEGDSIPAMSVS
jgi:hypothetical protein